MTLFSVRKNTPPVLGEGFRLGYDRDHGSQGRVKLDLQGTAKRIRAERCF